jgi:hypothetical protein
LTDVVLENQNVIVTVESDGVVVTLNQEPVTVNLADNRSDNDKVRVSSNDTTPG